MQDFSDIETPADVQKHPKIQINLLQRNPKDLNEPSLFSTEERGPCPSVSNQTADTLFSDLLERHQHQRKNYASTPFGKGLSKNVTFAKGTGIGDLSKDFIKKTVHYGYSNSRELSLSNTDLLSNLETFLSPKPRSQSFDQDHRLPELENRKADPLEGFKQTAIEAENMEIEGDGIDWEQTIHSMRGQGISINASSGNLQSETTLVSAMPRASANERNPNQLGNAPCREDDFQSERSGK